MGVLLRLLSGPTSSGKANGLRCARTMYLQFGAFNHVDDNGIAPRRGVTGTELYERASADHHSARPSPEHKQRVAALQQGRFVTLH